MKSVEVVAAAIRRGDKFFATQRGYGPWKDYWEYPGGKIEAGETPEEALVREIREELAAEIGIEKRLCTIEWDYPDFHLSMDCYWCEVVAGKLTLFEAEDARWLTKDTLRSVPWLPADRTLVDQIAAQMCG